MSIVDPSAGSASDALRNLRPLSVGEILDRAFSICFKNLIAFMALVIVVVGPQMLFYYLGSKSYFDLMGQQLGAIQGAAVGASAMDPTRIFQAFANGAPYFLAFILIGVILVPLSNAAVVSGVSRAYLGLPVRFAQCYGDAVPRYWVLLGLMLLWFFSGFAAFVALYIFTIIVAIGLVALGSFLGPVGGFLAVVIGIAAGVASLLAALTLYLAGAYSFVAAVLEHAGVGAAYSSGFARVFGSGQLKRSLGVGASLFGIVLGLYVVGAVVGTVTFFVTHSFSLDFMISGIVGAFTYPFAFAVVAVSYYDVRIRREGFDLQMLAAQLASPTSSGAGP